MTVRLPRLLCVLLFLAVLVTSQSSSQSALTIGGYTPPLGVVLQGGGTASAIAALIRKDPVGANPEDIVNHTILTRLDVAIRSDATVAQINAMLAAINGGIVTMRPLFPVITVAVPRQADPAAIEALAATVRSMPGIRLAISGRALDASLDTGSSSGRLLQLRTPAREALPAARIVGRLELVP